MTRPPLELPPSGLPFLPMVGCPSLLRSFKLWIKGTNVVEWNSRRVTCSIVPREKRSLPLAFTNDEYEVQEAAGIMDPLTPIRVAFPGLAGVACPFEEGKEGILLVNINLARMDFRSFLIDNFIAIFSSIVTLAQATAVMDLIEERWEEWIGDMPLKFTYPALEGHEWRIVTGFDPKNTRQSYLISESWPG
nr:alkaline/neutral invertase E, chloroplastic-like [Nicotiana tomentosiformis]